MKEKLRERNIGNMFDSIFEKLRSDLLGMSGYVFKAKSKYFYITTFTSEDSEGIIVDTYIELAPLIYEKDRGYYVKIEDEFVFDEVFDEIGLFKTYDIMSYEDVVREIYETNIRFIESEMSRQYESFLESYPVEFKNTPVSFDEMIDLLKNGLKSKVISFSKEKAKVSLYQKDEMTDEQIRRFVRDVYDMTKKKELHQQAFFNEIQTILKKQ